MAKNEIILINLPPHIDYNFNSKGNLFPSFGLLLVGTLLRRSGYDVRVIDSALNENYIDEVLDKVSDSTVYIGLSVMTTQIPFALAISKAVKSRFNVPVVWGGPHPTLFPAQTLRNGNIDVVVINEGAFTAVELADKLRSKKDLGSVKGVGFKDSSGEITITGSRCLDDINELPEVDYSLIDVESYIGHNSPYKKDFPDIRNKDFRMIPLLTGLGCAYKCRFCINVILKRRYRYRRAQAIIDQIKYLMKTYNANSFVFLDEDFFINKKRTLEFIRLVEKENLKFNWRFWCRVDHFSEDYLNSDLISRLGRIGHGSMVMGGESANQETLNYIQKGITPEQIMNSARSLEGYNIRAKYSFMVGLENENMEQIYNTIRFCMKLKEVSRSVDIDAPILFRLYPGSPIYNNLVDKYNIDMPVNLEGWEEFLRREKRINYVNVPWAPRKLLKELKPMEFALNTCTSASSVSGNLNAAALLKFLEAFSKSRINNGFFKFPVEYWLYSVALKSHVRLKEIMYHGNLILNQIFNR